VATAELPSFDLVVATVDRVVELDRLLASLEGQSHRDFRILLVDQNEDDRLDEVFRRHPSLDVVRLRASRGLSRARNVALGEIRADVVAFPDDDCVFPDNLLERVARRFAHEHELDGLTGRAADERGRSSASWRTDPVILSRTNLWNRAISFTIFLRAQLVGRVGAFDEQLGLGSGTPWSSGEEIDYLIRALDAGGRIAYDPSLAVVHDAKALPPEALRAVAARDGASIGHILRQRRYPLTTVARMIVRPAGGVLLALARGELAQGVFHWATLRGRLRGYFRASSSAKTSA
jgi:GT2 family glycosyltransferase